MRIAVSLLLQMLEKALASSLARFQVMLRLQVFVAIPLLTLGIEAGDLT